jgi:hypothetical protein
MKGKLWGGEFRSDGYFINTAEQHGNEQSVQRFITDHPLGFFDTQELAAAQRHLQRTTVSPPFAQFFVMSEHDALKRFHVAYKVV